MAGTDILGQALIFPPPTPFMAPIPLVDPLPEWEEDVDKDVYEDEAVSEGENVTSRSLTIMGGTMKRSMVTEARASAAR
jgi:hypothetical protein